MTFFLIGKMDKNGHEINLIFNDIFIIFNENVSIYIYGIFGAIIAKYTK